MAEINEYKDMTIEKYKELCEQLDAKWEQYQKEIAIAEAEADHPISVEEAIARTNKIIGDTNEY